MRVVHVADLHMEFSSVDLVGDKDTVLVLAGDTYPVKRFEGFLYMWLEDHCERFKAVVWVDGNHEYYRKTLEKVQQIMQQYEDEFKNFHYLNDSECYIEGQHFLGGTLWTNFNQNNPQAKLDCQFGMNDYQKIRRLSASGASKLSPKDVLEMHNNTYFFLRENVTKDSIIVTHHAPSFMSSNPCFANNKLTYAYCSDYDKEILEWEPKAWIHGHLHYNISYTLGKTLVSSFSRGYNKQGTNNFVKELPIKL